LRYFACRPAFFLHKTYLIVPRYNFTFNSALDSPSRPAFSGYIQQRCFNILLYLPNQLGRQNSLCVYIAFSTHMCSFQNSENKDKRTPHGILQATHRTDASLQREGSHHFHNFRNRRQLLSSPKIAKPSNPLRRRQTATTHSVNLITKKPTPFK